MSDVDLQMIVKRIVFDSDELAFRRLFDLYFDRLLAFSNSFLQRRDLAEEAVEDVFINIWMNRATLVNIGNIHYYLFKAVKNSTINYQAKYRRQSILDLDTAKFELQVQHPNPEEILISREALKNIQEAIDQLPSRCRLIFELVKQQEFKYREVAQLLNLSVKTVESQMSIALSRLSDACLMVQNETKPSGK